ncbi:MAG TPA: phosphoribosylglycinamide formyltransferase [Candidatus Acidoferrales bacterium]|nr:phosphoribosylglycinamide formyltransferase [Candidatus Acidoferrales bacterium]
MKLAVLVSGRGTNLLNIIKKHEDGFLKSEVVLVISDHQCEAIERSKHADIHAEVIDPKSFIAEVEFGNALINILRECKIDFVVLAGFLKKIPDVVIEGFKNKILNIHPALLPSFGGKGMYGMRVHQAVIDYGCRVSGVTVHIVDSDYDHGPVVLQKCVPIEFTDTAESLAAKIHQIEYQILPEAIKLFEDDRIKIEGRRVFLL